MRWHEEEEELMAAEEEKRGSGHRLLLDILGRDTD